MVKKEIKDFGVKIGGARKDIWCKRGLCIEDIMEMTKAEKEKYIKRDNIWPKLDVKEELEKGTPRFILYWKNEIRKTVVPKNKGYISDEEYIECVRKIRSLVEAVVTETDIERFEENALNGGFFVKLHGRTYDYVNPYQDILSGNKFLKLTGRYGKDLLKRKMEKEGFALSQEELKAKQFPIVYIDGKEFFIEKRGEENFLVHSFFAGKIFYYVDRKEVVLKDGFFAVLNEKNRILFCDASEEKCIIEREIIFASQQRTGKSPKKRKEKWVPKQFQSLKRDGKTWRSLNRHVDGDEILKRFGIRAGEFGNWTNNLERQTSLDQTYDAFCDIAYTLGIDDTSVSLPGMSCGSLAIAFGARGRGDAVAHYEPLREVINLTKLRGAGSLSHEWAHALDHFIGQNCGKSGLATECHEAVLDSLTNVMHVIHYKEDGTLSKYYTDSIKFNKSYAKDGQGYWSSDCELFARAFACYLSDKMQENGQKNDYLNGHCDTYVSSDGEKTIYAYPRGEERKRINQAINELITDLKKREFLVLRKKKSEPTRSKEKIQSNFDFVMAADGQLYFG